LIPELNNISQVSVGNNHSLVLTDTGQVYTFGNNGYGQLGLGKGIYGNRPTLIPRLNNISQIASGDYHSFAVNMNGKVYGFGLNNKGQLGFGDVYIVYIPTDIMDI
jgi:alpha-tubulin suppressor-like RCC1 family protein